MLTPEIVQALRAPFPPAQIKWKIQTNPRAGSEWAIVVAYVDARDVAERLDLVTGGDWSDDYQAPVITAGTQVNLMCSLTVRGVTRRDVGTVARPTRDGDATKDLHSDAFKRAAAKFGAGAHIYRFPHVQARVEARGQGERTTYRLTKAATQQLDQLTQQLLAGKPLTSNAFSDLRVWGSAAGADGQPIALPPEPEEQPSTTPRATTRTPRQNGTNGASPHTTNDTHAAAARPTNGANGHTAVLAPSSAKLSCARAALREAEQATGVAKAPDDGATAKQRSCIQQLIADLSADEQTIQGLAALFSAELGVDGAALLSDPNVARTAPLSAQAARTIIRELQALR